jgi:acylphosphatase
MKTVDIIISGRVQKVGFRACIRRIAQELNVGGTVANLSDGKVRICATGESMILEKFVSMVYSCPRAVIREVRISETPVRTFNEFSIVKNDDRISTEF